MTTGLVIFFCGKMGAGKTTLAQKIAKEKDAILISEDDWLAQLYTNKVQSVEEYKYYSDKVKAVVLDIAQQVLSKGVNIVLDFPANTKTQRQWLRSLSDNLNAEHICYFVDRTDEVCLEQLLARGNPNTDTVEMFYGITKFFTEPSEDELITIIRL